MISFAHRSSAPFLSLGFYFFVIVFCLHWFSLMPHKSLNPEAKRGYIVHQL